jgi:SAM-dependent methyltransferase
VWPEWLSALLRDEVHRRIQKDPRTLANPGTLLGWPENQVYRDVIDGGQADFDEPIGHLDGDDRALLYARFNQRGHLQELVHAFERLFDGASSVGRPTVIDLGCGPFTTGLALAATLQAQRPFRYYGVDRAQSMLRLGARLARGSWERGGLHPESSCWFGTSLNEAVFGPIRGDLTIVVASYLFASPSLDVSSLVEEVLAAIRRVGLGAAAVLYTNSSRPSANASYPEFRDRLVAAGFEVTVDETEEFQDTLHPRHLRYALLFRPEQTAIDLGASLP